MMYMHGHRVLHGNLKPTNVILDDQLEPNVTNFCRAEYIPPGEKICEPVPDADARYSAPEILAGDAFDFKADIYSFGILAYMLTTGLEPFFGSRNRSDIALRVMNGSRPSIPEYTLLSDSELIRHCWDSCPEFRPRFEDIVYVLQGEEFLEKIDRGIFKEYQDRLSSAMFSRGCEYLYGKGVDIDQVEAAICFKNTAVLGHVHKRGWGVEQNWSEAVTFYERGAKAGDAHALYYFGRLLRDGRHVKENPERAFRFFKRAARRKEVKAYSAIGTMLRNGCGVPQNYALAVQWFQHAARRKDPRAIARLAAMYLHGLGVEKNVNEAIRLYREAADLDSAYAFYKLGQIYSHGRQDIGLDKDIDEAKRLLQNAVRLGHSLAAGRLQKLSNGS
jgi:TPR repeat protein